VIPKVYRHIPSGKEYLVLAEVTNATPTDQFYRTMVLYTPYTKSATREKWYVMDAEFFRNVFEEKNNGCG